MIRFTLSDSESVATDLLDDQAVRFVKLVGLPSNDPTEAFTEAMRAPMDCPSIHEEKSERQAIVFADDTRVRSPFVPLLVEALANKGDLKIICASGSHNPPSEEHFKRVLGEELYERFRGSSYVSTTKGGCRFESIGVTSRGTHLELNSELMDRDLVVSTLNVQPHYFAGYEGGSKALLPGCSSLKTILENHGRSIGNPMARELMIKGNDVREDIDETSAILEQTRGIKHRVLDFVLNPDGSVAKSVYGRPPKAHRFLVEGYARRIWTVEAEPARLVITVADGPPGLNLYQALKAASFAADLAAPNLEPKSRVLLLASLKDGVGGKAFVYEMEKYGGWDASKIIEDLKIRAKTGDTTESSQKLNRLAMDDARTDFAFVSPNAPAEVEELLAKFNFSFYRSMDEAIADVPEELLASVAAIPHGPSTVPVPNQV